MPNRTYILRDADNKPYESQAPGVLGGHRKTKIYGRLDCRGAARAITRGGYVASRVFFADEPTAIAAGYRPCAVCMPADYAVWKAASTGRSGPGTPSE
ncbi:Ada metal-binding domain-containing protein [Rhodococcus globerulus]|uniref:Ada metal-binding domain-containing protein n=1 Tax=Rhodococcus globerulus TaxID=33008 RepID=A0ABU4BX52_RHOGO|nr:Ada metal-binding domain-containing protein [Rhodococcus globerulus]MDV6268774.1 Ada metal-binding domain-containing protein [Rhodococcus globerulus]